jgi:hypothetical protein
MNTSLLIWGLSPYKKRCLAVSYVIYDGPKSTIVVLNNDT